MLRPTFSMVAMMVLAPGPLVSSGVAAELSLDQWAQGLAAVARVQHAGRTGSVADFDSRHPSALWLKQAARLDTTYRDAETHYGEEGLTRVLDNELARMRATSRAPHLLRAMTSALADDPLLVRRCLVWPRAVHRIDSLPAGESGEPVESAKIQLRDAQWQWWISPLSFDTLQFHTAVWTGVEMIVWGGRQSGIALGTGGRYEVATDTWLPLSTDDAPMGRASHSAVWTGSEMLVWGGVDTSYDYLGDGGRYDPVSGNWTLMSPDGAPTPRAYHEWVWTGNEMIVWAGGDDVMPLNTGGRYDPLTDSWTTMTVDNAPWGRTDSTAVWTGDEMIVWGGGTSYTLPPSMTNTGGRYDPQTNTWLAISTADCPGARYGHAAVWTGTEMIVWGGGAFQNDGGRYNPVTDSWSTTDTSNAPTGRAYTPAVWTGHEMIIWGGHVVTRSPADSGGHYDPVTDTWIATQTAGVPLPSQDHTAVWTGAEMLIWGGYFDNQLAIYSGSVVFADGFESATTSAWSATVP